VSDARLAGRTLAVATEADLHYATELFVALHTTGGSLSAKFDRNEDVVLGLAARSSVEQFTIAAVQRWTGWTYYKARRVMVGYEFRSVRFPGLLDKSPALSLSDQTISDVDGEGRDVKRRTLVFSFDVEVFRTSRVDGQVWLEPEPGRTPDDGGNAGDCCTPAATGVATFKCGDRAEGQENGGRSGEIAIASCSTPENTASPVTGRAEQSPALCTGSAATSCTDRTNYCLESGSAPDSAPSDVATDVAERVAAGDSAASCCNSIDPHAGSGRPPARPNGAGSAGLRRRRGSAMPGRLRDTCYQREMRRFMELGRALPSV